MKQKQRFRPGIKCPRCYERALITPWRPPRGIDPGMREYWCRRCKLVTYKVRGSRPLKTPSLVLASG